MIKEKYKQDNYMKYVPELGVFDFMDSPIIGKIRSLKWDKSTTSINQDLDTLSLKYYKTEQLWWVIAIFNNITDPFNLSEQTSILYIPDRLELEILLSNEFKKV